jgi:hypothetical protein
MLDDASDENFDARILELCPNASGKFRRTSDRDRRYNCLAWVVGDTSKQWVPGGEPVTTRWPAGAPRELALEAIVASYKLLGFVQCEGVEVIAEVEFVALFVDGDGDVIHAARQLPSGKWTSKIGLWEDIEHDDLESIEGGEYGRVGAVLRRGRMR